MTPIAVLLEKLKGIAQTAIHYSNNIYEQERYEELQILTAELMHELSTDPIESIQKFLTHDTGYATPKTDIRALVRNHQ